MKTEQTTRPKSLDTIIYTDHGGCPQVIICETSDVAAVEYDKLLQRENVEILSCWFADVKYA